MYINKSTIRDIPKYCHLGEENSPCKTAEGYANRENIPADMDKYIIPKGESLFYHADGNVTSTGQDTENPSFEYIRNNWLQVDKATRGNMVVGAVNIVNGQAIPHPQSAQALYFYENCQGNYPDNPKYDKKQNWDKVGDKITEGQTDTEDYKDEVICGTYVEVEGYYSANYKGYISSGPIKYRFMLGQNVDYDYNALRNRHYKLTLKFKGYANQPDWHIEYEDEEPGLYPPEEFLMSYMYNVRHEMPIRLTGKKPIKVTMQIVENNWAPYDPTETDQVPKETIEGPAGSLPFRWNKEVYEGSEYHYGLHPVTSDKSTYYDANILKDPNGNPAPDWVDRNVTHIWVGFLALHAPPGYEDETIPLPAGIYNVRYPTSGQENFYDQPQTYNGIKNYFQGVGDRADLEYGNEIRPANHIPLYQNVYNIPAKTELDSDPKIFKSGQNNDREGRNSFKAALNQDNSVTIYVPMFTQPKDMGYISGFSGNNPYESYYRKAVVKITAEYEDHDAIVKYINVFQTNRIVNPKAVWRTWDNKKSFDVKLMYLKNVGDAYFTPVESMGEWEAWVATPGDESTPLTSGTFSLEPLEDAKKEDGKIKGITGSNITFKIMFWGVGKNETDCGKIIIHYHDKNCEHSIYVRQGYNVPVKVTGDETSDRYWSSYAIYKYDRPDTYNGVYSPVRTNGVWTFPGTTTGTTTSYNINDLKATLTVNPLALGTMFKRGNYDEGIMISNNKKYLVNQAPGVLTLSNGESKNWDDITGIPYLGYSYTSSVWNSSDVKKATDWEWSQFESTVPAEDSDNTFIYDVPTIDDYKQLMTQGFGIGVAYADGATSTAISQADAFGYFNEDNAELGRTSEQGMRGFIVYNLQNFNQIFFPLGYSGVGRRTIQNAGGKFGVLRYGNQADVLSVSNNPNNQYRPIPYNNPNNPGVVYWAKKKASEEALYAMDMNYFDLTFAPYDYAVDFVDYGDAIPIKPIVIKQVNVNAKSKKKTAKK